MHRQAARLPGFGLGYGSKMEKTCLRDHENGQMVMFSRGIIQILVVDNFEPLLCLKLQKKSWLIMI